VKNVILVISDSDLSETDRLQFKITCRFGRNHPYL